MNPSAGAIGPVFAFPDRNDFFQRVDQPLAGGKGRVAMRRTDRHGHARFADFEPAEPMNDGAQPISGQRCRASASSWLAFCRPFHYTTRSPAMQSAGRRIDSAWCPRRARRPLPLEKPLRPRRPRDRFVVVGRTIGSIGRPPTRHRCKNVPDPASGGDRETIRRNPAAA